MIATELKEIHALVGEASSLWNQVEELWYLIFTCLMRGADRAVIDAIYNMFPTGSMQRQLITTIAPIVLQFDLKELQARNPEHHARRRLLKRIGQLNATTNALSGKRNLTVHTIFEILEVAVPPKIVAINPSKPSNLQGIDFQEYLTQLIQDTTILVIDLADLRDDFIEQNDPGHRDRFRQLAQSAGLRILADERKVLRAKLHEAVQKRSLLKPLKSAD